jgi:hypothetical protein
MNITLNQFKLQYITSPSAVVTFLVRFFSFWRSYSNRLTIIIFPEFMISNSNMTFLRRLLLAGFHSIRLDGEEKYRKTFTR